jgi:hypothetical protein
LENIPEDCHIKLVTDKISTLGITLPDNVMKVEYTRPEKKENVLDLSRTLSLHQMILEGVSLSLKDEDLILAKREIDEMLQQVQKID